MLGLLIGIGLIVALGAYALKLGDAEDLLFILYFETFPEHWHDNYNPFDLLSRTPSFYGKWLLYTGGSLALAVPFIWGRKHAVRDYLQALLIGIFSYSLLLPLTIIQPLLSSTCGIHCTLRCRCNRIVADQFGETYPHCTCSSWLWSVLLARNRLANRCYCSGCVLTSAVLARQVDPHGDEMGHVGAANYF